MAQQNGISAHLSWKCRSAALKILVPCPQSASGGGDALVVRGVSQGQVRRCSGKAGAAPVKSSLALTLSRGAAYTIKFLDKVSDVVFPAASEDVILFGRFTGITGLQSRAAQCGGVGNSVDVIVGRKGM